MILSRNAIAVMIGGGAGAVCRTLLGSAVMGLCPSGFPLGVLCVNALGGFLMGLLQGWMRRTGKTFSTGYCLLGTGFLGGFTTFSTFSLDTFLLFRSGDMLSAGLNAILNMVLCLCAVWGGYALAASPRGTLRRILLGRLSILFRPFLLEMPRVSRSSSRKGNDMRTLLLLFLFALLPFTARAASLLPGGDYPAPDCRSPLRPLPGDSPMDWRLYRSDMEAYRQCVEAYLATARQDAERIRKRMEKAVREYNEESGNL